MIQAFYTNTVIIFLSPKGFSVFPPRPHWARVLGGFLLISRVLCLYVPVTMAVQRIYAQAVAHSGLYGLPGASAS
ncbi:hypothetical protein F0D85_22365 [Escherichia coli]|nr:hypothetical protein [Escherichia coli]